MKSAEYVKRYFQKSTLSTNRDKHEAIFEKIQRAQDQSKTTAPASHRLNLRSIIMKSPITKLAAAAVIVVAVMLSIHLWDKSIPSAYAFEQTVEAMQGKRSFHIQTYFQQRRKDEFWAEFDEEGKLIRYRQKEGQGPEGSLVTLWENGVQSQYSPPPDGVHLMQRVDNTGGGLEGLEEFDPETIVQEIHTLVADGDAVMEIQKPAPYAHLMTIRVTRTDGKPLKRTLVVDPVTKFVVRVDNYWGREGEQVFHKGIEVLEYNEAMDPGLFEPNFPEDTILIDQVAQEVGMAQGEMTDEEVVVEILHEALEALAKEDYAMAGKLWGGAPTRLLTERCAHLRPASTVSVGSPEYVQNVLPVYRVKCTYEVERDGQMETISPTFTVRAVSGQPGRWYVAWYVFIEDEITLEDGTVREINDSRLEVNPTDRIVKGIIVPEVQVGDYTLGMSKDDVLKSLGQPDNIFHGDEKYTLNNLPRRYYMVFSDISFAIVDGSVNGIGVHRPSYKFPNGLGVGDSEQDIIQAFGDDFHLKESEWKDFITYESEGLTFEIHKKDRTVIEINITPRDSE